MMRKRMTDKPVLIGGAAALALVAPSAAISS